MMKRFSAALELSVPALGLLRRIRDAGYEAYAVGGCVRDALLGRLASETDIATSATPEEIRELFPRTHDIGASFGVILVVEDEETFEVATFRSDGSYEDGRRPESIEYVSLETDALRRDFTVNAFYYDPDRHEILDPVDGRGDLDSRLLRAIGEAEQRFAEDHLRLLRCVRFAVELGFEIESSTWAATSKRATDIQRISPERVRNELDRILTSDAPTRGLELLLESGMLAVLLPEIAAMVGVEQPPQFHPEGDVFVHTCLALEKLERRTSILAWAALLHDVGKPPTFRVADRIRFDGHVQVGCELAREILQRLRFDRESIERIVELVHLHLKFADAPKMRPSTLKRFLRTEYFEDHLTLHRADCLASHEDLSLYEFCQAQLVELSAEELQPQPLLRGADLLAMGYVAGPLIGEILSALETAQLDGLLSETEAASQWVSSQWPIEPQSR